MVDRGLINLFTSKAGAVFFFASRLVRDYSKRRECISKHSMLCAWLKRKEVASDSAWQPLYDIDDDSVRRPDERRNITTPKAQNQ